MIIDVNDHSPQFIDVASSNKQRTVVSVDIVESAPVGTEYQLPTAVDPDSPHYSIQRYTLTPRYPEFQLRTERKYDGSMDVRLVLKHALDREARPSYPLTLEAHDGGSPSRSASCQLTVVVVDANDNRPVFSKSSYETSVPENAVTGSTIARVRAEDADDGDNAVVRLAMAVSNI